MLAAARFTVAVALNMMHRTSTSFTVQLHGRSDVRLVGTRSCTSALGNIQEAPEKKPRLFLCRVCQSSLRKISGANGPGPVESPKLPTDA